MLLRDDAEARRWGAIAVDATGRVVGILDARSPRPAEGAVTERMFTGIHVLERALVDTLRPVFSDVIRDAYIPALLAGETIRGETLPGTSPSIPRLRAISKATSRCYATQPSWPTRLPHWWASMPRPSIDPRATIEGPVRIEAGAVVERDAQIGPLVVPRKRCAGDVWGSDCPGRGLARGDGGRSGRAGCRHRFGNGRDSAQSALATSQAGSAVRPERPVPRSRSATRERGGDARQGATTPIGGEEVAASSSSSGLARPLLIYDTGESSHGRAKREDRATRRGAPGAHGWGDPQRGCLPKRGEPADRRAGRYLRPRDG